MTKPDSSFYITTAIDYPNSVPHMGHAFEKVVADFYARCAALRGKDTRFLIGLDEHGQKIQEAAERDGTDPQTFVDQKAIVFRDLYEYLEISNDDFVRTSEERHRSYATDLYERVRAKGDIYKGAYSADYCISCERAISKSELVDGKCPVHDRPTTKIEEESYFFRLGKYRDPIREHIEANPSFIVPEERRNEILSRLRDDVHDLSISRSTFKWGVPLPDDPEHVLYVWFDALSNYISALTAPEDLVDACWPADCHVIGKDILWFHTVIWPAILMSAEIELPRQIYAHGFILDKDGRKMAKQLGNVIDPLEVAREYSVDVLRFYFLRAFSGGQDGKFSVEDLEQRYNSELANDFGNLVMRVTKLVQSRAGGKLGPSGAVAELDAGPIIDTFLAHVDAREHHKALDELWAFVRSINVHINEKAPWKVDDDAIVGVVLYDCLEALRTVIHLLSPVMPKITAAAAEGLGFELVVLPELRPGEVTYHVKKADALFPRRDPPKKLESEKGGGDQPQKPKKAKGGGGTEKDPFAKLELRVGRIVECAPHPDADRLYAMKVDVGDDEPRSICAGLREFLEVSDLQDRKVVVLANLKPAVMRGVESRGMILATDRDDGKVVPVDPGAAEPGDRICVADVESAPKKKLSKSEFDKAPLVIQGGRVTYGGKALESPHGPIVCDAQDGAPVR
jgi:methionyl-tRNA synthetase